MTAVSENHPPFQYTENAPETPDTYVFPLSYAQQQVWFIHQLEEGNRAYNLMTAFEVHGLLDRDALRKSFSSIIQRHETLRTTFGIQKGKPIQIVHPRMDIPILEYDVTSLPEDRQYAEAESIIKKEIDIHFDLEKGPLLRPALFNLNKTSWVLVLVMHHIITDGWSMRVFYDELAYCYTAFSNSRSPILPDLPIQYADYAVWEQKNQTSESLQPGLTYFKNHLAPPLPILDLVTDHARPPVQTFRGAWHQETVNIELTNKLRAVAHENQATLYMTLLSAFYILLHRYSGQTDIVIGTPVANRNRREVEPLIGIFINTIVLRANLSGNPAYSDFLKQIKNTAIKGFQHQDVPFEKLVEVMQPERNPDQSPLFQTLFVLQNATPESPRLDNLEIKYRHFNRNTSLLDLSFSIHETNQSLSITIQYNTDLWNGTSIHQMAGRYVTLLNAIARHPHACISDLEWIPEKEQKRIQPPQQDHTANLLTGLTIQQLFESQVRSTPDHIAIDGHLRLTYHTLNAKANQIAHYLIQKGISIGTPVAVLLDRSPDAVIAQLAILKAGGTYVPLDISNPANRQTYILHETDIKWVISHSSFRKQLHQLHVQRILLDKIEDALSRCRRSDLQKESCHAAYIMYTSGSTGSPKGVIIPHSGVIRLVKDTNYIQIGADDTMAFTSNMAFDAATFEIWGALLNGARLVPASRDTLLEPDNYAAFLRDREISIHFVTTALFNKTVDKNPDIYGSLRVLLFGGEACDAGRIRKLLSASPPEEVVHVYGPTENTTFSTFYRVRKLSKKSVSIPIGNAISGSEIHILDDYLQPVPVGVPGEIILGGTGLANGYVQHPVLTAQKFIPHPFSVNPGTRLYRTGDIGRWLHNGTIQFIGRRDNQIKIRGFRIELNEVEEAIRRHPEVEDAAVKLIHTQSGEKRLAAYWTKTDAGDTGCHNWHSFLQAYIPDYMIPSTFQPLDHIPVTSTGKIDREALPEPDMESGDDSPFTVPHDQIEMELKKIWESHLGSHPISLKANFFHIGGHSLLAAQIMSEIESVFHIKLPLITLFKEPTIEMLAKIIRKKGWSHPPTPFIPLQTKGTAMPIFAVPPISNVFRFYNLSRLLGSNQPFYGLSPHWLLDDDDFDFSVENMAVRYVDEILKVTPGSNIILAGYSLGGCVAYEMAMEMVRRDMPPPRLILFDAYFISYPVYARYLPRFEYLAVRTWDIGHKIRHYIKTGMVLRGQERRAYFQTHLEAKWQAWKMKIGEYGQDRNHNDDDVSMRLMKAMLKAWYKYIPEPYPGKVILFRAKSKTIRPSDHKYGWTLLAKGGIETHMIKSGHSNMLESEVVRDITSTLKKYLNS